MSRTTPQIFIGNIIHCKSRNDMQLLENGYIIIIDSKILAIGEENTLNKDKERLNLGITTPTRYLTKSQILIPGFIDCHLHAPQYPNCGLGIGEPLLKWLTKYTFPLEKKYKDNDFSLRVYNNVVSDLVKPIITPRFALSCDMEVMTELGKIAKCQDLHIQTHISENKDEVKVVETQYGMKYAATYDKANLLTEKTVLAHAIHLSPEEMDLIACRGSSVAHCPDSNICLKSGTCDVKLLWKHGITVGLGTDISGGSSPSLIETMKMSLTNSLHIGFHSNDYTPLTYQEVFYLATLGGSEALSLSHIIGNFEINKNFDALIVDMGIDEDDYLLELTPKEILQKLIYTGDDRNVISVFVDGKQVK